jgi:hypothetical protein
MSGIAICRQMPAFAVAEPGEVELIYWTYETWMPIRKSDG